MVGEARHGNGAECFASSSSSHHLSAIPPQFPAFSHALKSE